MKSRVPEFLYFDLGNVLLTFDQHVACRQVAELTGLTEVQVWSALYDSGLQERYERGEVTSRAFYNAFCSATCVQPDYRAFHHAHSAMFDLNVRIIPIVAHLWAAGYRLGILSNTCDAHWEYVSDGRFKAVREFFQTHMLSHELRCSKPEPAIYQHAAKAAGVAPDRIFFVDDRPENVDGARHAGWDAVHYEGPLPLARALRDRGVTFNY
jgi:putative hydrolase of the HAD superfamily